MKRERERVLLRWDNWAIWLNQSRVIGVVRDGERVTMPINATNPPQSNTTFPFQKKWTKTHLFQPFQFGMRCHLIVYCCFAPLHTFRHILFGQRITVLRDNTCSRANLFILCETGPTLLLYQLIRSKIARDRTVWPDERVVNFVERNRQSTSTMRCTRHEIEPNKFCFRLQTKTNT